MMVKRIFNNKERKFFPFVANFCMKFTNIDMNTKIKKWTFFIINICFTKERYAGCTFLVRNIEVIDIKSQNIVQIF